MTLVQRHLRLRAKRSALALLWPVVSPFLLMALYVYVFRTVFDVPIDRYPDFLLCGLLPWGYLTITLHRAITSISMDPELVRKVAPRFELVPISEAISGSVNLIIGVVLFAIALAVRGELRVAIFPAVLLPIVATVLLVCSGALTLALIDVYNRDLRLVLGNLLVVWFFLLPVVYREGMAPSRLRFLQSVDPMNLIVGQMRDILYFGKLDHPGKAMMMALLSGVLLSATLVVFKRLAVDLTKDV